MEYESLKLIKIKIGSKGNNSQFIFTFLEEIQGDFQLQGVQ